MLINNIFNDFKARSKSMWIYSKLSPKAIVTGETNLVAAEVECSPGRIWFISGCRGVEMLLGETQKYHRAGFYRVCLQRGVILEGYRC